jgi:hypothetical protein
MHRWVDRESHRSVAISRYLFIGYRGLGAHTAPDFGQEDVSSGGAEGCFEAPVTSFYDTTLHRPAPLPTPSCTHLFLGQE